MITIGRLELYELIRQAGEEGARQAIMCLVTYNFTDAAKQLGISSKTLSKRVEERKIRTVDGRITGAELMRYLKEDPTQSPHSVT